MPLKAKSHFLTFFICLYQILFYKVIKYLLKSLKYAFQPCFCAFHRINKVFSCLYKKALYICTVISL